MKIIVACDSFKGCISSIEINQLIQSTITKINNQIDVKTFSIGDGGEGTMECISNHFKGKKISIQVHDPLMRIINAEYAIINDSIAVIEMASASGLTLVQSHERNPLKTTTFGVGEMIKDAIINHHIKEFIVGIGGSATNDCGCGMLQALGYRFLDKENNELKYGGEILNFIENIDCSNVLKELENVHFTIACDVNNPLYGPNGAAFVYAKQKGATDEMIIELDKGLQQFSTVVKRVIGKDINSIEGSGAAGGLGGGFLGFMNCQLQSGINLLLDLFSFEESLIGCNYLITGEGKIDHQSFMGKVLDGMIQRAKKHHVKVIAIGGSVDFDSIPENILNDSEIMLFSIQQKPISLIDAMNKEITKKNVNILYLNINKTN